MGLGDTCPAFSPDSAGQNLERSFPNLRAPCKIVEAPEQVLDASARYLSQNLTVLLATAYATTVYGTAKPLGFCTIDVLSMKPFTSIRMLKPAMGHQLNIKIYLGFSELLP